MLSRKRAIWGLAAAIVLPRFYLLVGLMPLPCTLPVGHIHPSHRPKHPPTFTLDATNDILLKHAQKIAVGVIHGAESVAIDGDTLYLADRYGNLFSANVDAALASAAATASTSTNSTTADQAQALHLKPKGYIGPGRPLGYHAHHGRILMCDSLKGLTEFDLKSTDGGDGDGIADGQLRVLSNRVSPDADNQIDPGTIISYANDLDVSNDGNVVYFTDASKIPPALGRGGFYNTMMSYMLTALQGEPTGRVLVYNRSTHRTQVLVPQLWFPNGIAVSANNDFLVIAETSALRLLKHHLKGEKAGQTEILLDGLPGYPDGVARASDGNFWVALIAPPSPLQWVMENGGRPVRWAMAWLMQIVPTPLRAWGAVIKVSPEGKVVTALFDRFGTNVAGISGVLEVDGRLWMGHLSYDYVSVLDLNVLEKQE